ncbi:MAG: penicillin-binding transpeptidase domain-containing protein [Candidatus Hydrothermia bacterium]|nr:penicillin-binding transpeptidase domain-containing protein [Candidatus Hydrothermia bacterium]
MKPERTLRILLWIIVGIIIVRLFQYQVLEHKKLEILATYNYLKEYKIPAPRGNIYDRNGITLATWKPTFRIMAIPKFLSQEDINSIKTLFGELTINLDTLHQKGNYVQLKSMLTFEEVVKFLEEAPEIKSLVIDAEPVRTYSQDAKYASHLIGYVSEASQEEIEKFQLEYGDFIGKAGCERSLDTLLRGTPGAKFMALDSKGNLIDDNPRPPIEPKQGKDISLTIDIGLQKFADSLFQNYQRGAVFGFNIKTGEVIILYSKPYFDPTNITSSWKEYINNPEKPLINRCTQGLYPPGSTFKLLTALVGLYSQTLSENTAYYCSGGFAFGNRIWLCWKPEGHGTLGLIDAIAQSCNVYFNNVGAHVGTDNFMEILEKFKLPLKTEIPIPGEAKVLIPLEDLLKGRYILPSSVINWSIGQGEIQVTPAWLSLITGIIAGNGKCTLPKITKDEQEKHFNLNLPDEFYNIVKEGMRRVVESRNGTAGYLYDPQLKISAKTGTAQNPHGREHSWFTCFFPNNNPEYVITVLVENAGHGSEAAAPIAFQLVRRFVGEKN